MAKLDTIQIDTDPAAILERLKCGFLHSHHDGKWRFSGFGRDVATVYCNDPTEQFTERRDFANGYRVAAFPPLGLYANFYPDGTRGLRVFTWDSEPIIAQMYAPRSNGERDSRQWVIDLMRGHVPQ